MQYDHYYVYCILFVILSCYVIIEKYCYKLIVILYVGTVGSKINQLNLKTLFDHCEGSI